MKPLVAGDLVTAPHYGHGKVTATFGVNTGPDLAGAIPCVRIRWGVGLCTVFSRSSLRAFGIRRRRPSKIRRKR